MTFISLISATATQPATTRRQQQRLVSSSGSGSAARVAARSGGKKQHAAHRRGVGASMSYSGQGESGLPPNEMRQAGAEQQQDPDLNASATKSAKDAQQQEGDVREEDEPGFYHEDREALKRSGAVVHEELRPASKEGSEASSGFNPPEAEGRSFGGSQTAAPANPAGMNAASGAVEENLRGGGANPEGPRGMRSAGGI